MIAREIILDTVAAINERLVEISHAIHARPEISMKKSLRVKYSLKNYNHMGLM